MSNKKLDTLVTILLVIGGLNWGLIAAMDLDIVATMFGEKTMLALTAYGLVGLAAVYQIVTMKASQKRATENA